MTDKLFKLIEEVVKLKSVLAQWRLKIENNSFSLLRAIGNKPLSETNDSINNVNKDNEL